MECKTDFKQDFQPVTFTITCQTPEDLVALWQRFNLTSSVAQNAGASKYHKLAGQGSECYGVWKEVNNVVKQLGWCDDN